MTTVYYSHSIRATIESNGLFLFFLFMIVGFFERLFVGIKKLLHPSVEKSQTAFAFAPKWEKFQRDTLLLVYLSFADQCITVLGNRETDGLPAPPVQC